MNTPIPSSNGLILRSVIHSSVLENSLLKGSAIALIGVFLIFISYYHLLPLSEAWANLFLWAGFLLIAAGLIPYKKLSRLQINPDILYVDDDEAHLIRAKVTRLSIPIEQIVDVAYMDTHGVNGLLLQLEKGHNISIPKDIVKATQKLASKDPTKTYSNAILLPHFPERSAIELREHVFINRQ